MAEYTQVVISFLPVVLYAIGGLIDAYNKKEKIDWLIFTKTLVVGAVSAGAISQGTGDTIISISATIGITAIVDKLINGLMKKDKLGTPLPAPNP